MTVFVDTSALYALLSADDPMHRVAAGTFSTLATTELVTHNYVIVEPARSSTGASARPLRAIS